MEFLFRLFTEDGNINKFIKILRIIFTIIISTTVFEKIFGFYDIVNLKEPNEIIEYFINGHFLAAMICLLVTWLFFTAISIVLMVIYMFILVPNSKDKIIEKRKVSQSEFLNQKIEFDEVTTAKLFRFILNLGAIERVNKRLIFEDDFGKMIREYLEYPHRVASNFAKLFNFYIQFAVLYIIANFQITIPYWLNLSVIILTILLIILFFWLLIDFYRLNAIVPILRKNEIITQTELKKEKENNKET